MTCLGSTPPPPATPCAMHTEHGRQEASTLCSRTKSATSVLGAAEPHNGFYDLRSPLISSHTFAACATGSELASDWGMRIRQAKLRPSGNRHFSPLERTPLLAQTTDFAPLRGLAPLKRVGARSLGEATGRRQDRPSRKRDGSRDTAKRLL